MVCTVLILKFGVLPSVNPPSKTLRGMFVLASSIAGFAGGAIAIFFWKAARFGIGAWGGFAFALWIQCFQNGGLIKAIGFRWLLYIGCGVVGFALCTIPRIHYHVLLVSTAIVGSSSFILGVDCFTTAGLKEFYIWNLGFPALFPKYTEKHIQFPVSQTMQIELGLIGAVTLMGIAVQLRILKVLQKKLDEIAQEHRVDEEAEIQAASRFSGIKREQSAWEKEHPTLSKHGRQESAISCSPLMKEREGSASPTTGDRLSSYVQHDEGRARALSGVSDFRVAPTSDEDFRRASRYMQNPGALPTLDLGLGIKEDVPSNFIAEDPFRSKAVSPADLEDLKRKEELLAEIQTIRRSIDVLKSETPVPPEQSRRPSMASRRTLSVDATNALMPSTSHLRPPRQIDPRARVRSLEFSALALDSAGDPISRPTSAPLRDSDWDTYIQERKLLQPPAGVTPPIATTPLTVPVRPPISPAVQDALSKRKRRESALGFSELGTESSEDVPLARIAREKKNSEGLAPVTILPPRRQSGPIVAPVPQVPAATRTRTFEELNERHREKIRDMQAPLTLAEREHAEIEAAKQRWERSKGLEREAVTRRQAEKMAALEKKKRVEDQPERERQKERQPNEIRRHSRSLSADKLAAVGSSSKRLSTLKVEDWQRYQQEAEMGVQTSGSGKRKSRTLQADGIPFPDTGKGGGGRVRQRSGRDSS